MLGDGQRLPRYYPARGWLTQPIIVYRHSAGGRTAPGPTAASRLSWMRAPDGRHAKADALSSPGLQPALSRSTLRAPVVHVVPFLEAFPNILSKCCKPYLATVKEIFENGNRVGFSVSKNSPYFLNVAKFWLQSGQKSGVCARITPYPPLGAGLP